MVATRGTTGNKGSSTAILIAAIIVVLTATVPVSAQESSANIRNPSRQWTITQRLRDDGFGQPFFNFSDSVHSLQRYIAVGSASASGGRGLAYIYYDSGDGFKPLTSVRDPLGKMGDLFGAAVTLFLRKGVMHIAVGATKKNVDGAVLVYRQKSPGSSDWPLQQTLTKGLETEFADNFGRWIGFDGSLLLISAVSRYQISTRFVISALNVKGTRDFIQSTGIDPIPGDPIFVFASRDGRFNSTSFKSYQILRDAPYTLDFGKSIALSGNTLLVGASFRQESRYGYGSDGDLIVYPGQVKLLDGSNVYNFRRVEIFAGGILTVDVYDTIRSAGGWLQMKVQDSVIIHPGGQINVTGVGFPGAPAYSEDKISVKGTGPGAGYTATSVFVNDLACNLDGAGFGSGQKKRNISSLIPYAEANGGGGSYGTLGETGTIVQCGDSGKAGPVYGTVDLSVDIQRGSGGGSGHPWKVGLGGKGGDGGGVVHIVSRRIINDGAIVADGVRGGDGSFYSGGGGGGSGGAIFLSGGFLDNRGYVLARGGAGGVRSTTSGSFGDNSVRGGKGGNGRIHLEFITTAGRGNVIPRPSNVTKWEGAVYIYKKNAVLNRWNFSAILPRLKGMMFLGENVALRDNIAAVNSDELSEKNPVQRVYMIDISPVKNSTSPIYRYRVFSPPTTSGNDLDFGRGLSVNNGSLVVQAPGRGLTRGVVHLFTGGDLFKRTDRIQSFVSAKSYAADYYGQMLQFEYPNMLIHVPLDQDDNPPANSRRSIGNLQLWRHITNISTTKSFVACDYAVATANTTVTCYVHTRDAWNQPAGEINDLAYFSWPTNLVFVARGKWRFTVYLAVTGPRQVYCVYRGTRIATSAVIVTGRPIDALMTNMTCTPTVAMAGNPVTCTIRVVPPGAGELNAAAYFQAVVYNAGDQGLHVAPYDLNVPGHGIFKGPLSQFIETDPTQFDFPTVLPPVTFVRLGVYQFTFKPWREGPFAAYVLYRNRPLRFPNPVLVDATTPPIASASSRLDCPAIGTPNRTIVCVLQLRDLTQVPAGTADLAKNFSDPRYLLATIGGQPLKVSTVWSDEGRISLLMRPTVAGTLTITAKYKSQTIPFSPSAGVVVSPTYAQSCKVATILMDSFTAIRQHVMGLGDVTAGRVPTTAAFLNGLGLCDSPKV